MRTIPERVATLETQYKTVVIRIEKEIDDLHKSLEKFSMFMNSAEQEIERIATKKVNDHYTAMENSADRLAMWKKKGAIATVVIGIIGQWIMILLWAFEKWGK